jgi:hypothetical protein
MPNDMSERDWASVLEKAAADVRLSVREALKQTVEGEVFNPLVTAGFSKVEHVVEAKEAIEAQERADEVLSCIGDIDQDETFAAFAERITAHRKAA